MREILFRGKRTDNGEWVDGYYLSFGVDMYSCNECIGSKDEHYIIRPCHEDFSYENTFEIVYETLSQYTGLKDKNGNKIFDGDKVSIGIYSYTEPLFGGDFEVVYSKNRLAFVFKDLQGRICYSSLDELTDQPDFYCYEIEIIGNIHEVTK